MALRIRYCNYAQRWNYWGTVKLSHLPKATELSPRLSNSRTLVHIQWANNIICHMHTVVFLVLYSVPLVTLSITELVYFLNCYYFISLGSFFGASNFGISFSLSGFTKITITILSLTYRIYRSVWEKVDTFMIYEFSYPLIRSVSPIIQVFFDEFYKLFSNNTEM